jgi:monothiol glutaredoxin
MMEQHNIRDWIKSQIESNSIVLFMKGSRQFPQCGFSGQMVRILDYLGVDYADINVLEDEALRQGIKEFTNWPTIPQLYLKGEFVGGCDIVTEMFQAGELQQMLEQKNIAFEKRSAPA